MFSITTALAGIARPRSTARRGEALVFGHGLDEQIGGQLEAGFVLTSFYENHQPRPRFVIDRYLPTFLASRAIKP